jgi:two-component system CheB/CheR fusion protein
MIDRLHFALKEEGILFLGKAEMLLSDTDRFDVVNMRQRLFRRKPGRRTTPHTPVTLRLDAMPTAQKQATGRKRVVGDLMVETSPLSTVGLDADGVLVAASAHARTQFGLTAQDLGRPFRDLELSYRPAELRSLIEQAHRERRSIRLSAVEGRGAVSDSQFYDIVVQPLWGADTSSIGTAITFLDVTLQTRLQHDLKQVREDLETAYEELQSTNEELETTNEELQSSIEELETTNEELQSTNEELETTNEELQSGNEELETMNEEMQVRATELDGARTFLEGVLSSIGSSVVVLSRSGRVRAWNRAAEEMWGLRAAEVEDESFFSLEFGLPVDRLRELFDACQRDRRPTGPLVVPAVNRVGRSLRCRAVCTPLDGESDGVVMLLEEAVEA